MRQTPVRRFYIELLVQALAKIRKHEMLSICEKCRKCNEVGWDKWFSNSKLTKTQRTKRITSSSRASRGREGQLRGYAATSDFLFFLVVFVGASGESCRTEAVSEATSSKNAVSFSVSLSCLLSSPLRCVPAAETEGSS